MEFNNSLGPFFCDYTKDRTDSYSHQEMDDSLKKIWNDEKKVKAMKSIWESGTTVSSGYDYGGHREYGFSKGMEAGGRSSDDLQRSELDPLSCWGTGTSYAVGPMQQLQRLSLSSSLNNSGDLLMDREMAKIFPRVKTPPPGILLSATQSAVRDSNEKSGSNVMRKEDGARAMGAWGGYENSGFFEPFQRKIQHDKGFLDPMKGSTEFFDFKKPTKINRKMSLESVESDISSLRSGMHSGSTRSTNSSFSDLENLSNALAQNQEEDEDDGLFLFGRFEKELVFGFEETDLEDGAAITRPRTGTTRADMDEFAKKFGYASQPRTTYLYRPRKGKYRKEF